MAAGWGRRPRTPQPVDPRKNKLAIAAIVVGAVAAVVGLFTKPHLYYVPGGLAVIAIVLAILAWPTRAKVWFALILAAMALAETLYGYTAVRQAANLPTPPPAQSTR